MRRKNLEIELQGLQGFSNPKATLEQYLTPASVAVDILLFANSHGDIREKIVAELGAGPGIFTIGACILGAKTIYAVEKDTSAIKDLKINLERKNCKNVKIMNLDVSQFGNPVHAVFQNTPFGAQNRHADLPFIDTALRVSNVVYSLHNSITADFLEKKIAEMGGKITHTAEFEFSIPNMYHFHRKERVTRKFVFFRIESRKDNLK